MTLLRLAAVVALVLTLLVAAPCRAAEPGTSVRTVEQSSTPPQATTRPSKKKSKKTGKKSEPVAKSSGRYQMLAAGERVVVLDTHTGETNIIEPRAAYQNVEVGRAWVVVTVLGNVSDGARSGHDK